MNDMSASPQRPEPSKPAAKPVDPLEAKIAGWSAPARTLMRQIKKSLPKGYALTSEGIGSVNRYSPPVPICSPLHVAAMTADAKGGEWARVIDVLTPDRRVNRCVIPNRLLTGKPRDAAAELAAQGLIVTGEIRDLEWLLRGWVSENRITLLEDFGWTEDYGAFLAPDGAVLCAPDTPQIFQHGGKAPRRRVGTMEDWQAQVAACCIDNPHLVFALSAALAGPLMAHTDTTTGIFHFEGKSSIGKSVSLRVGSSVWGNVPEKLPSWTTTSNGLEGALRQCNEAVAILDELPKNPPKDLGNNIYMTGNGIGKARAEKTGHLAETASWQVLVLSSGEITLAEAMAELDEEMMGGQAARFVDITVPHTNAHGSFVNIHGHGKGHLFSEHIKRACRENGGHAGPAFVDFLLQHPELDKGKLRQLVGASERRLWSHLGLVDVEIVGLVARVLKRFAAVALAGELASHARITGWEPGVAEQAVFALARGWFDARGGNVPHDNGTVLKNTAEVDLVRAFLAKAAPSRFMALKGHTGPEPTESAGWEDAERFYLLPEVMKGLHKDYTAPDLARALQRAGYLHSNPGNLQYRATLPGGKRPWTYAVARKILEASSGRERIA